jgi:hypothetical protein
MNATDVGRDALWLLWKSLSLPVFILLATLEPVVSFVLGSLALLGVLTALFFKSIGAPLAFHKSSTPFPLIVVQRHCGFVVRRDRALKGQRYPSGAVADARVDIMELIVDAQLGRLICLPAFAPAFAVEFCGFRIRIFDPTCAWCEQRIRTGKIKPLAGY